MEASHLFPNRPGWRRAALIVGGCLAAGVLSTAHSTLVALLTGQPVGDGPLAVVAAVRVLEWVTWAPFVPVVVWAARRYPLVGRGWPRRALVHLALFAAIQPVMGTVAVLIGSVWPVLADGAPLGELLATYLGPTLLRMSFFDLVLYLLLAVGLTAADAFRRQEAQRSALAEAELGALRARLHPHFLFNALHALAGLVRSDPDRAADAIEELGALLRYVLRLDRERRAWVGLDEEVAFVRRYLDLEGLKLGGRLRVGWDVEDEALEAAVPPFTLQPLVENAVRHAAASRREGGRVWIAAHVDERGRTLHVEVADDGPGADAAAVAASPGLGLRAVRRQLEAAFGPATAVEVETRPGAGFAVRLRVPFRSASALGRAERHPAPEIEGAPASA